MSEEEIIKGITNIIYTCNDVIEDKEWYDQEEIESAKEQLKFTEGLLDLYNKEKEKNKELEKNKHTSIVVGRRQYGKTYGITKDLISKDKIREKIKELEKEEDKVKMMPFEVVEETHRRVEQKTDILKELLEGE